ncbi:BTB domain protein [Rhizoctonia solani 123E]|uniref:BTB domain protein n=1 Tax=Rhizoctonia solani 123E TaxID=1423351 RepID=A0A074RLV5_9AGAM|nr:BTB domain protein [Rhizoctonia solani 123E]
MHAPGNPPASPSPGVASTSSDGRTPANKPVATKRHSKFYFDNTLIVIQVEDTLFNVHKYQLLKSETFSDMFKMPKRADGELEEGSSPERPIVMEGAAAADLEALMTVLYASYFSSHQPTPEASLIIPAFRLANMWNFSDLRSYLLPLAETVLSDIDKIVFAREFDIQSWLVPSHRNLCERPEPITTDEARKLGVDSLLLISRMRELFRPAGLNTRAGIFCERCIGVSSANCTQECADCHQSTYPSYYHITKNHNASTTTTLTTKINEWVANGFIMKE